MLIAVAREVELGEANAALEWHAQHEPTARQSVVDPAFHLDCKIWTLGLLFNESPVVKCVADKALNDADVLRLSSSLAAGSCFLMLPQLLCQDKKR